jgi:hypothetical protein
MTQRHDGDVFKGPYPQAAGMGNCLAFVILGPRNGGGLGAAGPLLPWSSGDSGL